MRRNQDELVFLPLGGAGEIGMNLNLYGFGPPDARQWVMVDVGVTFGNAATPGVEIIVPDPSYIESLSDDLLAIVLTHAHEDHIGAIQHLWPRLKAPIYATPFTAYLVREKLKEKGLDRKASVTEIPLRGDLQLGPFRLELVTLTHSIPEPNGVIIRTPLGTVLHTGDWKIDPDPIIGETTDEASLRAVGEEGVLAMICDSTNVFVEGSTGSESDVRREMTALIKGLKGKVAVAAFASNVARLDTVVHAAGEAGRSVCLVGRSMKRIVGAARHVGLLSDMPDFVSEQDAAFIPDDAILFLVTGSQGEPRAALAKLASGNHPHLSLGQGDTVIFSSRKIPGNEISIGQIQNALSERGVSIVTESQAPIHVSGHPARDELRQMYQWARPQIAVPVHGERRHIIEHARLALDLQTPQALTPRNGDLIRLAPGPAMVIDEVPAGRLHLDGGDLVPEGDGVFRDRKRLGSEGHVTVAVVLDGSGRLKSGPDIRTTGLTAPTEAEEDRRMEALLKTAEDTISRNRTFDDPEAVEDQLMRAVRKAVERLWGKRPHVEAVVLEL
jgi:ribonuclease J